MTTPTDSPPPRNFADLSEEEKAEVRRHFHAACQHRARQWDAEHTIESILGRDIDVDFAEWAVVLDDEQVAATDLSVFNDEDLICALDED